MGDWTANSSPTLPGPGGSPSDSGSFNGNTSIRQRKKEKMEKKSVSAKDLNLIYGEAVSGLLALSISSPNKAKSSGASSGMASTSTKTKTSENSGTPEKGILKRSRRSLPAASAGPEAMSEEGTSSPPEKKVGYREHRQCRKRKIKLYSINSAITLIEGEDTPFEKKKRTSLEQ